LPRSLPTRDLMLDLTIGVGLTVYLTAATSIEGGDANWEIVRDLTEGLAVTVRRIWTLPALGAVMVVTAFNDLATWPYPLGLAIMLYTIAAEGFARRRVWLSAALGAILLLVPWPSSDEISGPVLIYLVPEMLLFSVAPVLFGLYANELSRRADTNERQQKLEAERIRAEERNRLANEIHDVVAHRVSLMVVHTGALKLAATDEKTRRTADLVRSSGRMALEELRELVGVLRSEDSAPLEPMATLDKLIPLIDEARTAGQFIVFSQSGEPRKLSSIVERTAFRVVQESLTNARKHAAGSRVQIHLTWLESGLDIEVTNSAVGTKASGFPKSGHGLHSLRERVSLVSGTFSAGPAGDGGWTVRASLPYGGGS
jgi:signal transduction histidine kinase